MEGGIKVNNSGINSQPYNIGYDKEKYHSKQTNR
jgi:hypothetical protein